MYLIPNYQNIRIQRYINLYKERLILCKIQII